ncbi:hypothetical protein B2J86_16185 [Acidovorax sp. SRB_14]|uniref:glycine zipper 2TM domain-containing protein n=1 Tax=Acidovorax sp. SRB_14 TaxID=1962699 RepID=UPI00156705B8|nr:glycine zipper 2TM domain-containing protein [Acidovorax sp. SRB_14]NMM82450.1 hypothetical protein [Acidovorax sp. SRB_14]
MKKLALFSLLACTAALASAQEQARVLSSTPIVQQVAVPQQVCGNETVYTGPQTTGGGAVLGAIAGGAAGNAIGGGSGRAAATALGVIGGALLGNQIEGNGRPAYQNVQRCSTETFYENRTVGYTVVYEYAGRQYTTQTQTDPGRTIAVQVQPLDNGAPYGQAYSTQPGPYGPQQGVISQPGVVVTNGYGAPAYPAVYGPAYPAPVYVNPAVSIDLGFSSGWGGHRGHWR